MKTYSEMAQSALQRIREQEQLQKKRRKNIVRAVSSICLCFGMLLGVGAWENSHTINANAQENSSSDIIDTTSEEQKDYIFFNRNVNIVVGDERLKLNINLRSEDRVEMSDEELNKYYGMDIFPDVPSDLIDLDDDEEKRHHSIYRRENGEVYWDQSVLNYSNNDFTRSVNIEIAKSGVPIIDYGLGELEKSVISGNDVYLSDNGYGFYHASFICNDTGFVMTMEGLTKEEIVSVIKSIIEE